MIKTITLASTTAFTSNAAIAVYIVIAALLVVAIAFTTIMDIRKKNEFRLRSTLDKAEREKKRKMIRFPELLEIDKKYPDFEKEKESSNVTFYKVCLVQVKHQLLSLLDVISMFHLQLFLFNLCGKKEVTF